MGTVRENDGDNNLLIHSGFKRLLRLNVIEEIPLEQFTKGRGFRVLSHAAPLSDAGLKLAMFCIRDEALVGLRRVIQTPHQVGCADARIRVYWVARGERFRVCPWSGWLPIFAATGLNISMISVMGNWAMSFSFSPLPVFRSVKFATVE